MQPRAVVVGAGPNGLSAAIVLAQSGFDVEVRETAPVAGGGARSGELTLPGFVHDLGSAVYPLGISSPFFASLRLREHGLEWIQPPAALAHPLDDGTAVTLERDVASTTAQFRDDASAYRKLFNPLVNRWPTLVKEVFRPLGLPRHPLLLARFGLPAVLPCTVLARSVFRNVRTRALFAASAAHSLLTLDSPLSSAFGLIFGASGHAAGWPIPRGGAQNVSNALSSVLSQARGRIVTQSRVEHLDQLANPDLTLCDVTPRQFLKLAAGRLPKTFRRSLEHYVYGPGIFKVDWALREPIPWKAKECFRAATVHVGGTLEEIAASEYAASHGQPLKRPWVLLAQPSLFDPSRAPNGQHTVWAYCHVPNGWRGSALNCIEDQIERFAPGFRECILAKAVHGPAQMEALDENLVGGDVSGGAVTVKQFFLRPTWRRYRTPLPGVYLCSASTPPGAAVHGLCGYWAAQWALSDFAKRRS
jgi:phytoene dehydrogenase-like protein